MPVFSHADSTDYTTHGSTFAAYVNPARGSRQLCAWRLTVPPSTAESRIAQAGKRYSLCLRADCTSRSTT